MVTDNNAGWFNNDSSHCAANSGSPYSPQHILNEELENILYEALVIDALKQL
jgi:hypothetical protein